MSKFCNSILSTSFHIVPEFLYGVQVRKIGSKKISLKQSDSITSFVLSELWTEARSNVTPCQGCSALVQHCSAQ
ncbi:hypothetical protein [Holospora curviuscula]|uniref:Uncharacterized protein n=1 Tax=Holospora curviuscula TaxID=1082868 RepID=A0A2S5RHZ4_9PROT|nr:hypothetical protein [Holospora curviuscula]PPE06930.1 hypothetical protein HCUR_00045 [Holospora curviuscula]